MIKKSLFFTFCIWQSASALLSPLNESIREYQALLNDERLTQNLSSGEEILEIKRNDRSFIVITNRTKLIVSIMKLQQDQPGALPFHLYFQKPTPFQQGN